MVGLDARLRLGLGAGTQVLTHIPFFLFPGIQGELSRALFVGAGWAINLAVAEWVIRRRSAIRFPEGRYPKHQLDARSAGA